VCQTEQTPAAAKLTVDMQEEVPPPHRKRGLSSVSFFSDAMDGVMDENYLGKK